MSKSHLNPRSRILITDTPDEIESKVMSAVTDSHNFVSYDPVARPGVANLLEILSAFDEKGRSASELATSPDLAGAHLGILKSQVSERVIIHLAGVRRRYLDLLGEDGGRYLDSVEASGAAKARASARKTMDIVRAATGL